VTIAAYRGQQPCNASKRELQQGIYRHRYDQQESQREHHAERENALAQPRHDAREPFGTRPEDVVEDALQLSEDGGRGEQEQGTAPEAGNGPGNRLRHGAGEDRIRDRAEVVAEQ
jgi:hypothetical protein